MSEERKSETNELLSVSTSELTAKEDTAKNETKTNSIPSKSTIDDAKPGLKGAAQQSAPEPKVRQPSSSTGSQSVKRLDNPSSGPYTASNSFEHESNSSQSYIYDPSYAGNGMVGASIGYLPAKYFTGPHANTILKTNHNNITRKASVLPSTSKVQHSVSNNSKPLNHNQHFIKPASGFQSPGPVKRLEPAGNFSSAPNQTARSFTQYIPVSQRSNGKVWNNNCSPKPREDFGRNRQDEVLAELGPGVHTQYAPVNHHSNARPWNNSYRPNNYRSQPRENIGRNGENKSLTEIIRGPRIKNDSSSEPSEGGMPTIRRDEYNLEEFQTEYENAKFYIIKSFSEDDVHKSIKYEVWSSTVNGNNKLDTAFREVDAKASETGVLCPVFLFFSVNTSGQFVGVAEMIGPVDYSKTMDFWQGDFWSGFFPINWHIIKDVPHTQLRHITLENNYNKPVTYTRDTQEVGLKQGLEMLKIFKSYSHETSVLDDYDFYENRGKLLKEQGSSKSASSQSNGF